MILSLEAPNKSGKSIPEFGETHSSVLGCERRPVSASIMSRSCFASFPVCVYKFSSHYLNNTNFIDNSLSPLATESPCISSSHYNFCTDKIKRLNIKILSFEGRGWRPIIREFSLFAERFFKPKFHGKQGVRIHKVYYRVNVAFRLIRFHMCTNRILPLSVTNTTRPTPSHRTDCKKHATCRKFYPLTLYGDRGSTVVKVLCYKSEGRWFDPS